MSACSRLAGDRTDQNVGITCSVSSRPPIFSPSSPGRSRRTMEDVWRNISLSLLRDRDRASVPAAILQDFTSGPFQRNPSFTVMSDRPSPAAEAMAPAPLGSPVTSPGLSSANPEATAPGPDPYKDTPFSHCGKRGPETRVYNSCDRRHKRLIKNRESAARSRARRQAYTTELEMEIERLKQENVELRKQQEKFQPTAPACDRNPRKSCLRRTLTSPF